MSLAFRNINATPADPVQEWGFEGMLAALDRGSLDDLSKLVHAVVDDPSLEPDFFEALESTETESGPAYARVLWRHLNRTPREIALARLRDAFHRTQLTQGAAAERLGTSRTRLNSYLTGKVTPSMDVLVAMEKLADERTRYQRAGHLRLTY